MDTNPNYATGGQALSKSNLQTAPSPQLTERILAMLEEIGKNLNGAQSEQTHLAARLFGEEQATDEGRPPSAPSLESRIVDTLSATLSQARAVRAGAEALNARL